MDMNEVVGRNIARARKRRKGTQEDLADLLTSSSFAGGWTKQVVSNLERGERQVDPGELVMFAAMLGVPAYELLLPDPGDEVEVLPKTFIPYEDITGIVLGPTGGNPRVVGMAGLLQSLAAAASDLAGEARRASDLLERETSSPLQRDPANDDEPDPLTPREKEILLAVTKGMTARQVAAELEISPQAVYKHLSTVREKLANKEEKR